MEFLAMWSMTQMTSQVIDTETFRHISSSKKLEKRGRFQLRDKTYLGLKCNR